MKKQLVLAAALFAATAQSAPSAFNPKYIVPAILGIQGEHLKLHNLLQNMAPQAAALFEKNSIDAATDESKAFRAVMVNGKKTSKYSDYAPKTSKYLDVSTHISTPLLWKYLLTYATPVGRRAPKGFHRTRMQQLASILKFVNPEINTQVDAKLGTRHKPQSIVASVASTQKPINKVDDISLAVIAALKHVPEIASRRELANRLSKTGTLVSSWSVPAAMRGKKYLMFNGPVGYAVRNLPSLLTIVKEAAQNYQDFTADKTATSSDAAKPGFGHGAASNVVCKLTPVLNSNALYALPFLSVTSKYYMLESDFQKLPAADQVAVYQAVYEDVTDFSDKLVDVLAPRTDLKTTVIWGKAAYADPKANFAKAKDAGIEAAQAALDAAKKAPAAATLKYNDLVAYFKSFMTDKK